MTVVALVAASLSGLLFLVYAGHNFAANSNGGGVGYATPTDFLFIRSGCYLSLASVILGLGGKGGGRWSALAIGGWLFWTCRLEDTSPCWTATGTGA